MTADMHSFWRHRPQTSGGRNAPMASFVLLAGLCAFAILVFFAKPAAGGVEIEPPHFYIVSVGINQYPIGSGLPSARLAEQDAGDIATALSKWTGADAADITVAKLTGSAATHLAIRNQLQSIAREATPNDMLFLFITGIGSCIGPTGSYEFAAYDSKLSDKYQIQNGLSVAEIGTLLMQIPVNEEYVILGSCGSYRAFDSLHAQLWPKRLHLIAPDGNGIESTPKRHGFLAASILDGLGGAADVDHSGSITWERLVGYLTWSMPENSNNRERLYSLEISPVSFAQQNVPSRGIELDTQSESEVTRSNEEGQDYALLVGTDKYEFGWPTLNNPIFDVHSIGQELVRYYGFQPENVIELHNPTMTQTQHAMVGFLQKTYGPRDRLFVYFAGHGIRTPIEGYVVFADGKLPEAGDEFPENLGGLMSFGTLSNTLDKINVSHILLVLDVCYGGLFDGNTRNGKTRFHSLLGSSDQDSAPREELIKRALEKTTRIYITSGDEDHQVSDGLPGEHSPFSRRFLSVLDQNKENPEFLDVATLYGGLRSLAREPKAGYFYAGLAEEGADYIFIPQASTDSTSLKPQ